MNLKRSICVVLIVVCVFQFLVGCAGTAIVRVNYQPPESKESSLASIPPVKIKLLNFIDKREGKVEPILIGRRQAAFGTPMGDVQGDRPVFEIVRDAVKLEFTRSGHSIVNENEDIILRGEIRNFWVKTDTTPLYWDVIGEASIVVEAIKAGSGSAVLLGPYSAKNVEHTYVYPSVEIMERVLGASLNNIIKDMSSDTMLINALKKE